MIRFEDDLGLSPADGSRRGVQLLLRVSETLNAEEGFEAGLVRVLAAVAETLRADAVCLVLPDIDGESAYRATWAGPEGRYGRLNIDGDLPQRRGVVHEGTRLRLGDGDDLPQTDDLDRALGIAPRAVLAVPLRLREELLGGLWASRTRANTFDDDDEDLLVAVSDRLAIWIRNEQLLSRLHERLAEREMLLQASRRVGESIDLHAVLDGLFDALLPVVHFDAAAVFLAVEDGRLALSAHRGYAKPEAIAHLPEGRGIVGRALRLQHGVLISDVAGHPDYVEARPQTRSEIAVPIVSNGTPIGVVNLESDMPEAYGIRELRLAELIAAQVASAIANARLHASRVRAAQVDSELDLAREIQLSLLPSGPPLDLRLQVAAVNVPSSKVGGDYYDWLVQGDSASLVIADVSGHGLSAALLTASMRTGFRMLARQTDEPAAVAQRLHALLYESSPANQFVAAVIAHVDLTTGTLRYCNAGHVPPLLLERDGGLRELTGGGPPLGLLANASYTTTETVLTPGVLLAMYTDGIVEAENAAGDQLGLTAIREELRQVREQPLAQVIDHLRTVVRAHRGRRGGHNDDVTLMTARWLGPQRI